MSNEVQRVRSVFKYAYQSGWIDQPVRYGPGFALPSRRSIREARAAKGERLLDANQLRAIIDAAGVPLRAMILLGVNCGYGNADIGRLPTAALDLRAGWATFPRPKTGVARRCPLWPETVAAVREALDQRPAPKSEAHKKLLFLDADGKPWVLISTRHAETSTKTTARHHDGVGLAFTQLLKTLEMHRSGLGYYTLRHIHETVSGDALDQVATDYVMGHSPRPGDMSAVYREKISDARLLAVNEHIRNWLFEKAETK